MGLGAASVLLFRAVFAALGGQLGGRSFLLFTGAGTPAGVIATAAAGIMDARGDALILFGPLRYRRRGQAGTGSCGLPAVRTRKARVCHDRGAC